MHEEARLQWVSDRDNKSALFGHGTDVVHVHIDEKCFYALKLVKMLYYPPGVTPEPQRVTSKTQIPSVMFLAAGAPPR